MGCDRPAPPRANQRCSAAALAALFSCIAGASAVMRPSAAARQPAASHLFQGSQQAHTHLFELSRRDHATTAATATTTTAAAAAAAVGAVFVRRGGGLEAAAFPFMDSASLLGTCIPIATRRVTWTKLVLGERVPLGAAAC